eukprot:5103978-Prymnesium_polylepis.1
MPPSSTVFVSVGLAACPAIVGLLCWRLLRIPRAPAVKLKRPVRVCVVGGGIGGVSACYFLRERLGAHADITLVEASSRLGGRCKVISLHDQRFEAGASIISELNQYFLRFMRILGLKKSDAGVAKPFMIDGAEGQFLSCTTGIPTTVLGVLPLALASRFRIAAALTTVQLLRTYGFWVLRRLKKVVRAQAKRNLNFGRLYAALDRGESFTSCALLLEEIGGAEFMSKMLSESANCIFEGTPLENSAAVSDLVASNMRCNYGGQDMNSLHGLVGLVSIAGGIGSRCFSVVGGNEQVIHGIARVASVNRTHLDTECVKVERAVIDQDGVRRARYRVA